jgi:hypothetical protein
MRCESETAGSPSVRNGAQTRDNTRKNCAFNYESPALTAELQARLSWVKISINGIRNIRLIELRSANAAWEIHPAMVLHVVE